MSPIKDVDPPSGSIKLDALFRIANSRAFGSLVLLFVLYIAWTWLSDDREKMDARFEQQVKEIQETRKETTLCNQNTITLLSNQLKENTETNKQILKYLEKHEK